MVVFPTGSVRWVIERANGKIEWIMPVDEHAQPYTAEAQYTAEQDEWLKLWRKGGELYGLVPEMGDQ